MEAGTKKISMPIGRDKIDCGIGDINYTAYNLQLKMIMEELEQAIQKRGAAIVFSELQNLNK